MNKWLLILPAMLLPLLGYAFTFTVTSTPETCGGNGALQFTTANTNPNGNIVYEVYLLPNTTVPVATVTTNVANSLAAGNYRIIAKETVGSVVTTQQQDVTINNQIVDLTYRVDSSNQACSSNSNIVVTILTGLAVSYEIFDGPQTFPLQTSNTFSGLPIGVYKIRVFDNCGNGMVSTFTVTSNPTGLNLGPATYTNATPPSCNFTVAHHTITPASGTVIGYPLQIQFVVHPPGGGVAQTFNSVLNSGDLNSQEITQTIPSFPNQNYDYDVTINDACASNFSFNFPVNQIISLSPKIYDLDCNSYFFDLTAGNFTPPYTLNFTSFPAGFNPFTFNTSYPGPYSNDVTIFGDTNNNTPIGTYDVTISDICGRTNSISFQIVDLPAVPNAVTSNNGCVNNTGKIIISIPAYRVVVISITAAPPDYAFPLPHDVSNLIDATTGILSLDSMPIGDYTFIVTNNCGNTLAPLNATIPVYANQGLSTDIRPGCELTKSSIKISSLNTSLTELTITAAPPGFPNPIPYNGTDNIASDGSFYMSGLPAGNYTFTGKDSCNFTNTITLAVNGYTITDDTFSLQANCGSFDIPLSFDSNATTNQTFWLQKLTDATNNTWGHPSTGVVYTESTVPNVSNSYPLNNNATNFNLTFNGTFRIVRHFLSYNNGIDIGNKNVTADKDCIEILSPTLSFNEVLEITDAYRMPCSGSGNLDVVITANGTAPIHYTIIEKDGVAFNFDNLNANIFTNLAPAVYTFQIEDTCGNIVNRIFDVNSLLSLVTITKPDDMFQCQLAITNNETFDLTTQTQAILGTQSAADFTLTYHTSLPDAQNNSNPIQNLLAYNPDANPKTVYARVVYNPLSNCYETTSFDVFVGETPKLNANTIYQQCFSNPVTIDVSAGNLAATSYLWSDGSTNSSITVSQIGITSLTVKAINNYRTDEQCPNIKNIEVRISETPVIESIQTSDWTYNENTITIKTSNIGSFEYSLDNSNFQSQNTFLNLEAGVYTVYVRDALGCGFTQQDVWLLYYPRFFTPNDDGYHDTWFIENAGLEPNLKVDVYDRFGKLMKSLDDKTKSWDGTYNGHQAVSTDYWFKVYRQDGRTHQGHFSLKR